MLSAVLVSVLVPDAALDTQQQYTDEEKISPSNYINITYNVINTY